MPEVNRSTDVLIVGAGPVGLTLAAALEARGVDVLLVDKAAEGAHTSRAAVIHSRTLEALGEIDVSDELVRRGTIVPRFTVRDRDRALMTIDFDGLPGRHPYTLMLPQDITEAVLARRLDELGGTVHLAQEIATKDQDSAGLTATMVGGDTFRPSYFVGPRPDFNAPSAGKQGSASRARATSSRSCSPTCTWTGSSTTAR